MKVWLGVFAVCSVWLARAQGGGKESVLKDMGKGEIELLHEQMETMQNWWCIEQRQLESSSICAHYGKTENVKVMPFSCLPNSGVNCVVDVHRSQRCKI